MCKDADADITDSMTKLVFDVIIRSTEEDEQSNICFGSLTIRCKPIWEISAVFFPAKLISSLKSQFSAFLLKQSNNKEWVEVSWLGEIIKVKGNKVKVDTDL